MDNETDNSTHLNYTGLDPALFLNEGYVLTFVLYLPVFLLALIANILVIVIVIKYQYMRVPTNYFLVNLAVADLLVTLICMPNAIWNAYSWVWPFGEVTCKLFKYLQCVSVAASIFTITAMSLDRYLNITQPFGFARWFNKKSTIIMILVLWNVSILLFSPVIFVTEVQPEIFDIYVCVENWKANSTVPGEMDNRTIMGIVWFVSMFAVPGFIITWAYCMMGMKLCSVKPPTDINSVSTQQRGRIVRERKRVAWILLCLALLFAICWLPLHIFNLMRDMGYPMTNGSNAKYLLLLGHANSAINPIIYCVMSKNFRMSVRELVLRSRIAFSGSRNNRNQWADSSNSSHRPLHKIRMVPAIQHVHHTLTRMQSSQKTTKTCAV